jgi:solute carrier family 45 protein 1/2/4
MAHHPSTPDTEADRFLADESKRQSSPRQDISESTSQNSAILQKAVPLARNVESGRDSSLEGASSRGIRDNDGQNDEQSPLLPPRTSDEVGALPNFPGVMSPGSSSSGDAWNHDNGKREPSKSSWYLFLLTISFAG